MTETAEDLKVQADTETAGPSGENGTGDEGRLPPAGDGDLADQLGYSPPRSAEDLEDSYRLDAPEGMDLDDELLASFRKTAARHGLSSEAFTDMTGLWSGYLSRLESTAETMKAEAEDQLSGEWGGDYQTNLAQAKQAARTLGGQELIDFLNFSGLGNHPSLVKAFWQVGRMISEDRLASRPRSGVGGRRSAAEILYGSN